MQLLRLFFSQNTPTATASWFAMGDLVEQMKSRRDVVFRTWFEIGLTIMAGKLIKQVPVRKVFNYLSAMGVHSRKQIWGRIFKVNKSILIGPPSQRERHGLLWDLVRDGDMVSIKAWIDVGLPLPEVDHDFWEYWVYRSGRNCAVLGCCQTLLEAGLGADPEADDQLHWDGPGRPKLITDVLWIVQSQHLMEIHSQNSKRMRKCVTVSGICAAAGRGLKHLRDYITDKPHPTYIVKQTLLQVALSEATEKSLESTVQVLLEYGVDIEVKLLTALTWKWTRPFKWLPTYRAVVAKDIKMIRLLAEHSAVFNHQEVLDATIGGSGDPDYQGDFNPVVDCLSQVGLDIQKFGPTTMLKAVGLLSGLRQPDVNTIKSLQAFGVNWDDQYFNQENLCVEKSWNGKEAGGMDLLQAAIRKDCGINTIRYLLDEGMQVHSRPCAMDGKSIIEVAMESIHRGIELFQMLLARVSDIREDPVWPKLLELSISGPCGFLKCDMDLFHYARSIGATLPTPTNRVQANRRLRLIPNLVNSEAYHEVLQEIWNDGAGLEKLHEEDLAVLLGEMTSSGLFSLACAMIDKGASVNGVDRYGSTPLVVACRSWDCPLWFIRYLLERNADVKFQVKSDLSHGFTALHAAAEEGNLGVATLLIEKGANVNSTENWGYGPRNPLDCAVSKERLDMVKLLLDVGGQSGVPGRTGYDGALEYAKQEGHGGIAMLLERHIRSCN